MHQLTVDVPHEGTHSGAKLSQDGTPIQFDPWPGPTRAITPSAAHPVNFSDAHPAPGDPLVLCTSAISDTIKITPEQHWTSVFVNGPVLM